MILTQAQNQIASDIHRFRVVNCGRRFGKTTLAVEEILGKAFAKDEQRICYIAPTYQQARDIAWEQLIKTCEPIIVKKNESRLEITLKTQYGGTSQVFLRGWEAIESLRGQRFDFIVLDEISSMRNFWLEWEEVLRPTLSDTKGDCLFISTPKGYNHFYDLYIKEKTDPDYKSFHFNTYDNPHIPTDELDKAKREMTEDRFAQEYMADFRKTSGLVYKEFNRLLHVYDDTPINTQEILMGVDFGYTNPAAILTIKKDSDNHFWINEEYYKSGKTTPELIEYARTKNPMKVYPDPAEPDRIEEMKRAGLPTREVSKDIEAGINAVRELFKTNRIHIHKSCINLISELETYHYPERKPNKNEPELPVKEDDHAVDALRYALYMQTTKNEQNFAHQFNPMLKGYGPQNVKRLKNYLPNA